MNKTAILVVLSLVLIISLGAGISPGQPSQTKIGDLVINQTTYFFRQKVDHFDPSNQNEYDQRFTVYSSVFNPVNGTVIIYIGGEGQQGGLTTGSGWFVQVAQQLNAMVICVEHRFYGVSQPFGYGDDAYSVENLNFLTVDQSLADLAHFITFVKTSHFENASANNPFLTVGGSYPGAMSAWFRYKYPHLTVGALASSAVINAILDFQQYDYQIFTSTSLSSPECPAKIQKFNAVVEETLKNPTDGANLKKLFNASALTDDEFLSYFGDFWAGMVQYGKRTDLCAMFEPNTFNEQLQNVIKYGVTDGNQTVDGYDNDSLKITKYDPSSAGRQWTWQVCTYFGWFQTANTLEPMRSSRINVDFFKQQCNDAFGGASDLPTSSLTNTFYGGKDIQASNIVFTNGVEDEWQWASIRYPQRDMNAIISDCEDCGHCVEFHYPKPTDSPQLNQTRADVFDLFQQWIAQFYAQNEFSYVQQMLSKSKSD